ncbi:LacI family DNA-binding transcriptional regulator [Companilactobacillus insicii]|uniref:LacI family DNA-binding transcriptional regulator n=1 Tax=Companilactobacillus insicii TaxID=1732567 RepID=UPI000F773D93|nr:LacI family DNA-binding transcriptional regulator [Companilactobacillus insicii]
MATLKDVAQLANVSMSTVSIIVNGKAHERSISDSTIEKVMNAVNELGYAPNSNARSLRYSQANRPKIALYWPFDTRTNLLSNILTDINMQIHKNKFDCELIVKAYENDYIEKNSKEIINNSFSGVIVGGPSQKDVSFLESLETMVPIVLINRSSEKLSTVNVNSKSIALMAVNLLKQAKKDNVSVVGIKDTYTASNQRTKDFIRECKNESIKINQKNIIYAVNDFNKGIDVAKKYIMQKNKSDTIFCESDVIALSMVYYFNKKNIKIPSELSIISIGTLGSNFTKYVTPSITTINVPSDKIANQIIKILMKKIENKNDKLPAHITVEPELFVRESFPEQ